MWSLCCCCMHLWLVTWNFVEWRCFCRRRFSFLRHPVLSRTCFSTRMLRGAIMFSSTYRSGGVLCPRCILSALISRTMLPLCVQYGCGQYNSCGGHAFSVDGKSWTFTGQAYTSHTVYTDGTTYDFPYCERPHLIFAEDGVTPLALTNGVKPGWGQGGDQSFTLLRPLATPSTNWKSEVSYGSV